MNQENKFKISAVIATYNREKYILGALNSLKDQSLNKNDFEIIIVNNNSTDRTEELCKNFIKENPDLNITYVVEKNQGLSFSRNRGVIESKSELITFLDDDAEAESDFLKNTVEFLNSNPEVAACGGKIFPKYSSGVEPKWISKYIGGLVGYVDYGNKPGEFPFQKYPSGSNMTIRKSILLKYNMFDTNLGRKGNASLASEEKDFFDRIGKDKKKIFYLPTANVFHIVDDYRLQPEHIKKLSYGVGASERIRAERNGKLYVLKIFVEYKIKLFASFILSIQFLLKGEIEKAKHIVLVRYYVLIGFFKKLS